MSLAEARQTAQGMPPQIFQDKDGTIATAKDWLDERFIEEYQQPALSCKQPFTAPLKNLKYQDLRYFKIPRSLRFNDRVSMAFSKELRVPFLDHRILEYGFSLPESLIFQDFRPKGILRKRLNGLLPDEVRLAPKRHIQSPQSEWFATSLRSYLGDLLQSTSFQSRGVIDAKKAIQIFNALEGKPIVNSFFLWQALNLENWFRMFIDGPAIPKKSSGFPAIQSRILRYAH